LLPALVLLLVLPGPSQAQSNPTQDENFYAANVIPENGSVRVDYFETAEIPLRIEDVSQRFNEETTRLTNKILLNAEVVGNSSETGGWAATTSDILIKTEPGEVHETTLQVTAGATITTHEVEVEIQAVYEPSTGETKTTNTSVLVQANPFPAVSILTDDFPDTFEPDTYQTVPITVSNRNYYPDTVTLQVSDTKEYVVSPPSSITLGPGETKTVFIDVRSTDTPWFRYTSSTETVFVEAYSETAQRTVSTTAIPLSLSGSTMQPWVTPHVILFLLGLATLVYRTGRKVREHRLAKGKPSYPGLSPGKEAEFEAMKVSDPDKADKVEDRLGAAYDRRVEAWKAAYAERKDSEAELQDRYQERHDELLERRERGDPDPETVREHRRALLERKKDLLERKREQLDDDGSESAT